jgi:hypothetical protein
LRRLLYLSLLSMLAMMLSAPAALAQSGAGGTFNCPDFASQAEAQQVLRADPSDPNNLDADNDGVACQTTPYDDPTRDEVPVPRDGAAPTSEQPDVVQYETDDAATPAVGTQGTVTATDDLPDTGGPVLLPLGVLFVAAGALLYAVRRR